MEFDSDLPIFLADFGVDATYTPSGGGASTLGKAILDQPGMTLIGSEVLATDYSLRYPIATFPAVKRGDTFLVSGVTYTAREAGQPASVDGLEYIVPLAKP